MGKGSQKRAVVVNAVIILCAISTSSWGRESASPTVPKESVEAAYRPKRLALVVGINEFQDPAWRSLHYAVKDAEDMAAALRDPQTAYFDQVIELTKPWETTGQGVIEALRQLGNQNMSTDDVVLVYISTHGTLAKDRTNRLHQYLVTCDTQLDDIPATSLDFDELNRIFNSLTSRRKVLIIAACHSGQGKSELPPDIQGDLSHLKSGFFVKPIETASEATVVIGVSDWGETALEDPELQHDIYTYFFLQGMSSYDRNEDGAVSISEAHDYAQRETYYYTHGRQRPFAHSDILGADPIILTGTIKAEGKPVVFSYSDALGGRRLRINGQEKGQLPDGFTTARGWNRIAAVGADGRGREHLLYIMNGERVDVDRMISLRSEPSLGVISGYRMTASSALRKDVLPDLLVYGAAYQREAFPTTNTSVRVQASYGQTNWDAELDSGLPVNVRGQLIETDLALLFNLRGKRADLFAGPALGTMFLFKNVESGNESEDRQSNSIYPALMGGLRFRLSDGMHIEVADRLAYQFLTVDEQQRPSLVNEISATVYFQTPALTRR